MFRSRRIRAWLLQAGLWALIVALMGYFGYHGVHGDRGLNARRGFQAEIAALQAELSDLEARKQALERRVRRLEPSSVDRDVLDEEARKSLGWLHPDDRILTLD